MVDEHHRDRDRGARVRIGLGIGIGFIAGAASVSPIAQLDASTSTLAQLAAIASHSRPSLATMFDSTGKLT